jgi:hypothetical protein
MSLYQLPGSVCSEFVDTQGGCPLYPTGMWNCFDGAFSDYLGVYNTKSIVQDPGTED